MKNVINISEYKVLKQDFETLTAKHREILHLVLFKVFNNMFMYTYIYIF